MTFSVRCVIGTLCTLGAVSGPAAQSKVAPPNKELEALQAHFEMVIGRRHDQLFSGITTVEQWQQRKQKTRAALAKMLWHDMRWPDAPPRATVTHRQDYPGYRSKTLCWR